MMINGKVFNSLEMKGILILHPVYVKTFPQRELPL